MRIHKDISNSTYGKWFIIRRISGDRHNKNIKYECKCQCGDIHIVYYSHIKNGRSKGCKQCSVLRRNKKPNWKGYGDISGLYWAHLVDCAAGRGKRKPIELNITIEQAWELFLKQDKKCALSGISLKMCYDSSFIGRCEHTASLDRIDSTRAYTIDNIQWVHKDINMMKRTYSNQYFIDMCKKVGKYNHA